jgi:hypothetical protein
MNKKEYAFDDASLQKMNDLPDHSLQEINDLCATLMIVATRDLKTGAIRHPNIALGALQKALGMMIAQMFEPGVRDFLVNELSNYLKENVQEWAEDEQ